MREGGRERCEREWDRSRERLHADVSFTHLPTVLWARSSLHVNRVLLGRGARERGRAGRECYFFHLPRGTAGYGRW